MAPRGAADGERRVSIIETFERPASSAPNGMTIVRKGNSPYNVCMSTLTVTAKGQITLRKDLLQHLGVAPGEKIAVEMLPDGRIEVKAARPAGRISDAFGLLKRDGQRVLSVEEISEAAAEGWAGER
jgi:bifunctional DNA-binding transcriptional regulator/antitoxin component of YhaV-PrlF toxin-antitoxin module